MKVLLLSALFPPHTVGGAEISAYNLASWLQGQGNEVGVIRAASDEEHEGEERTGNGVRVWRVKTSHLYSIAHFTGASAWKKPFWHLQDHFDPRIRGKIGAILDQFQPDLVNIHLLQGLGYPALLETATRRIPVNYVLPDLALACIRASMFKNGKDCPRQCFACKLSSKYKRWLISKQAAISFVSPSRANLATLSRYFPISRYRNTSILNPNAYPAPSIAHREGHELRLLYAGRLHESKGILMLVEAAAAVAGHRPLRLSLAGKGPLEAVLRERYSSADWFRCLGFLSHEQLADEMARSDILCIPSIWAENSPGVVIQALGQGLPVIGSDRGGIPELVKDGINGRLVREQTVEAWCRAIDEIAGNSEQLKGWRAHAEAESGLFDQDAIGARLLKWMQVTAGLIPPDQGIL